MNGDNSIFADSKPKTSKSHKSNKVLNLFEIKRPKKHRSVHRTNSIQSDAGSVRSLELPEYSSKNSRHKHKVRKGSTRSEDLDVLEDLKRSRSVGEQLHQVMEEKTCCDKYKLDINSFKNLTEDLEEGSVEYNIFCETPTNDKDDFFKLDWTESTVDFGGVKLMNISNGEDCGFEFSSFNQDYGELSSINSDSKDCDRFNTFDDSDSELGQYTVPFWLMKKSFIHQNTNDNLDDEVSPQISEESLTIKRFDTIFKETEAEQDEQEEDSASISGDSATGTLTEIKHPSINTHQKKSPQISEESLTIERFDTIFKKTEPEQDDPEEDSASISEDSSTSTLTAKKHRFIKNSDGTSSRRRMARRRTGILMKRNTVKELAHVFENFEEASKNGETESYRKSFFEEMEKENEQMLLDGFDDDVYLSIKKLHLDDDGNKEEIENSVDPDEQVIKKQDVVPLTLQDVDDFFGKMCFNENIEDGVDFVEAYNQDGMELVICTYQLDRHSIDLNQLNSLMLSSEHAPPLGELNEQHLFLSEDWQKLMSSENYFSNGDDSKRNTMYSTTSGDSFEEEVPIIDERRTSKRRETITDEYGEVRIERIKYVNDDIKENDTNNDPPDNENVDSKSEYNEEFEEIEFNCEQLEHEVTIGAALTKKSPIMYILEELVLTEKKYVRDLGRVIRLAKQAGSTKYTLYQLSIPTLDEYINILHKKVINDYKPFLQKSHPDLCRTIFGNLQQIYDKQKQFCHALANCRLDQNLIARVFIDYETLFDLYPRYFKGTPRSNAAVKRIHEDLKKRQEELQNKLGLAAYILTPVQRLGKYKLLLENIIKELKKNNEPVGSVEMALDIIKKYMRKGNDAVAVGSIMNSTIKNYGSFIMREKFALMKPRRLDVVVFLFELVVVITVEVQNDKEQFMFYKCIYTNDLRIATFDNNTIHLTDFAKEKKSMRSKYTYVLDARLPKIKDTWKHEIEKILWNQLNKIKESTMETRLKNKTLPRIPVAKVEEKEVKAKSKTVPRRSKSIIGNSVFYMR